MLSVNFAEIIVPSVSSGILLIAGIIFYIMYKSFHEVSYRLLVVFMIFALIYTLLETVIVYLGVFRESFTTAVQLNRLQQLCTTLFIPLIPLLLNRLLKISPLRRRVNAGLGWFGAVFSTTVVAIAFSAPDYFLSVTDQSSLASVTPAAFGRGVTGIVHHIRDGVLIFYLIYAAASLVIDAVRYPGKKSHVLLLFIGLGTVTVFGVGDLLYEFLRIYPGFFPKIQYSRAIIGMTLFALFAVVSMASRFIHEVHDFHTLVPGLQKGSQQALRLAHFDIVTGLPNRNAFEEQMGILLTRMKRQKSGSSHSILYIDIDDFKAMKISLGYSQGDAFLKIFIRRIQQCIRDSDILFRAGADEFLLIIHDIKNPSDAAVVASKIIQETNLPVNISNEVIYTTISIGITMVPEDGDETVILTRNAHSALCDAKKTKNTYRFFTKTMEHEAFHRIRITSALRDAIEENRFSVVYQPIVTAAGEVKSAEALLRWNDPEMGEVPPDDFIKIAEESGLILPIGAWVLQQVYRDIDKFSRFSGMHISINLSTKQLHQNHLNDVLKSLEGPYRSAVDQLQFEITETSFIENLEENMAAITLLRDTGYTIAIDDFGTGYSSLSYLRDLPIQVIKIDRSFVRNIPGRKKDNALLRTIIALAKQLDLTVIAEGVELKAQFEFLIEAGCDYFQGFYFSKPLIREQFMDFVQARLSMQQKN
jgi:diguanylate cyclase (GGDEF)-like protein